METYEKSITRAFISFDFEDEVIKELARVEELIEKLKFNGKLTELENLHLTLKFLGEVDNERIAKIKEALAKIKFDCFNAQLGNLGVFHFNEEPKIVWVKILGKEIYSLQAQIDSILEQETGIKKEERFMGHTTLARIKYTKSKEEFEGGLKAIHPKRISFKVSSFVLKSSELRESGPVYQDLERYELKR